MNPRRFPRGFLRDVRRHRPAWVVVALGVAASFAAFEGARRWELHVAKREFAWTAQAHHEAIRGGLERIVGALDSLGRFVDSSAYVSRDEFAHFAAPYLPEAGPGLAALALVTPRAANAAETPMAAQAACRRRPEVPRGETGRPQATDPGYGFTVYRAAFAPNEGPLESSVLLGPGSVRKMLEAVAARARVHVTPPFRIGEGAEASRFVAIARLARTPGVDDRAAGARASPARCLAIGFVELDAAVLAVPTLPSAPAPLWTEWIHRDPEGDRHRLVSEIPTALSRSRQSHLLHDHMPIAVGESAWELRSVSRPSLWASAGWLRWSVLLAGLGLTGLTALSVRLIVAGRERDLASSRAQTARAHEGLEQQRTLLEGLLQNVLDGILTFDATGTIDTFNPAAERIFALPADEIVGGSVDRLLVEPAADEVSRSVWQHPPGGDQRLIGTGVHEVRGRRANGTTFPLEIGISEMHVAGEQRFIACFRDVTERKENEERLRQALRVEAVGQLTGGVAHDFNNLLTVILGNLELLERRLGEDSRHATRVAASLRAARRGSELTRRLLAFARRQPLEPDTIDANQLVVSTLDLVKRALPDTIEVEPCLDDGLWKTHVDAAQLENSIVNLAVNARDAMPEGGRLLIETANAVLSRSYAERHVEVEPGEYVMIAISDTGAGMPPEVQRNAFEPYFTTKETGKGTGLGLSMVHGFVKQSKGHIQIYSELGSGTTIRLYFPRDRGGEPATAAPDACEELRGGTETILLVEDEEAVRSVAAEALRELGYSVLEAGSGPEALRILEGGNAVDLLFTDVVMPGRMSGLDLSKQGLARRPELRILYTSGYTRKAVFGAEEAPDALFLIKPYSRDDLARAVRAALDGR